MTNPSDDLVVSIKTVGDNELDKLPLKSWMFLQTTVMQSEFAITKYVLSFCRQSGFKSSSKKSSSSATISPSHTSVHSSSL